MNIMKLLLVLGLTPSFAYTMDGLFKIDNLSKSLLNTVPGIIKEVQSSDGTKIALLYMSGTIALCDKKGYLLDAEVATNIPDDASLRFNYEGTKIIVTTLTWTEEYILVNPQALHAIKKHFGNYNTIIRKTQSQDGTRIVTLDTYGTLASWDRKGNSLNRQLATGIVTYACLGFNHEGTKVSVTTSTGTKYYDSSRSETPVDISKTSTLNNSIVARAQSKDGTKIAIFYRYLHTDTKNTALHHHGYIALWAREDKLLDSQVAIDIPLDAQIRFNDEGTKIIVTTTLTGISIEEEYDIIDPQVLKAIKNCIGKHNTIIKRVQSHDGTKIVTLDAYGTIALWDGKTGNLLDREMAANIPCSARLHFNPQDTKVIVNTLTGIKEYGITNSHALLKIRHCMGSGIIIKKNSNHDNTKLVTLDSKGYINIWDGITGDLLATFAKNPLIKDVSFNIDSTKIILYLCGAIKEIPLDGL